MIRVRYLFIQVFFIEGCTSGYNRQVAVYDCVLLRENMGCSTSGYYSNNNLFRLYKWVQSRMQQFYKWVLLHKTWLFYKWVLQQQRFILVVQLGTIEKVAVLQVSITAQKHGLFYKWVLQRNLLSDYFRY